MTPTDAGSQFPEKGMSATPRTDDVLDDNNYFGGSTFIALRNLCRQLERELNIVTANAEKAETECVEWRRLLQMSRDDREQDLVSEINDLKRQLIACAEQPKAPYTEPKAT
jgi:hypothetical protein